jgi:hypothetical protein
MDTIGSVYCASYRACLARVVLGSLNNTDAFEPSLVCEHPDDLIEWPCVELFVPAVSLVFANSDVRKVPHDDRGDTANVCISLVDTIYTESSFSASA